MKIVRKILKSFRPHTKSIQFSGTPSGDLECFCWDGTDYKFRDEKVGRLYPNDVMDMLECVPGKKYQFTVIAEEIE